MLAIPPNHFPVALIAAVDGTYKNAITRRAKRERWPKFSDGTRFLFQPPEDLQLKCKAVCAVMQPRGLQPDLFKPALIGETARATTRLLSCLALLAELKAGGKRLESIKSVSGALGVSERSLRSWLDVLLSKGPHGLTGLRQGRPRKGGKS